MTVFKLFGLRISGGEKKEGGELIRKFSGSVWARHWKFINEGHMMDGNNIHKWIICGIKHYRCSERKLYKLGT